MKYATNGLRATEADSFRQAAEVFAKRIARKVFGRRGGCRTCEMNSYAADGSLAEFNAFIGTNKGNETTGYNFKFTVYVRK